MECRPAVGVDRHTLRLYEPPHKLSAEERAEVLAVANSPEFGHLPPSQIVPRLAYRGVYAVGSDPGNDAIGRVRRVQRLLTNSTVGTSPICRAWCGDGFFFLYLFIDIFSRKIVGWQVYDEENSTLASELLRDICQREGIGPNQVVLHSDNGSPMKGASMRSTLQALGAMSSFSRPAVSAIRFVTPAERHHDVDAQILLQRQMLYATVRAKHPRRWSGPTAKLGTDTDRSSQSRAFYYPHNYCTGGQSTTEKGRLGVINRGDN